MFEFEVLARDVSPSDRLVLQPIIESAQIHGGMNTHVPPEASTLTYD